MSFYEDIFKFKKPNFKKLESYGFAEKDGLYSYETYVCGNDMRLTVDIDVGGSVGLQVIDTESEEPYTLFLVEGAQGEFVGKVRAEVRRVLENVAEKCFFRQVFKGAHTSLLLEYSFSRYGDEPEFLWADTPDCAVLRRKDTKKWYAAILTVAYRKLGVDRDGTAEIVDIRMQPEELDSLVDGVTYFRGWHMNKKHWATMLLDGSADLRELKKRLDDSYDLAVK